MKKSKWSKYSRNSYAARALTLQGRYSPKLWLNYLDNVTILLEFIHNPLKGIETELNHNKTKLEPSTTELDPMKLNWSLLKTELNPNKT